MINKNSKIFVAGHKGLVGSAIIRKLISQGYKNILFENRKNLDLTNQSQVLNYIKKKKPEFIFIAAAKVGGILSNYKYKADYIYDNLMIQTNIINSAYKIGIKKLIFLGSSCVYPKNCKQPIKESYLLDGKLEETNDAYAIAKIAGIKMCQSYNDQFGTKYLCLMPTNTFGPNDNYDVLNSHFVPALIKKIYEIKSKKKNSIKIWGDGSPRREIIYVDDIADACIYFMKKNVRENLINIGTGHDKTIKQYTDLFIKTLCPNLKINIKFDKKKPNGVLRKVLDVSLAKKYGWKSKCDIKSSIIHTYENYSNLLK